jgi:hypothetical protein
MKKFLFLIFTFISIQSSLIAQDTFSSIEETACESYLAPDGQSYTVSGLYVAVIPNTIGGDSIITIDLTMINNSLNSITEIRTCEVYVAPDGQELTESGIYEITIPNAAGCDSIITIDLTVTVPTMVTITESVCGSYTAPDGMVYTTSGIRTAVIPNAVGCDSTITINLTVNTNKTATITRTSCGTYTAPDGQVYTTSGVKTAVISTVDGCDSTITINLTVNSVPVATTTTQNNTSITASPANMSYQWINCSTNTAITSATNQILEAVSGTYSVVVTNSAGCSDTSNCVTITNTANLSENEFSGLVNFYPNPSSDFITITLPENKVFKIEIIDINGKIVKEFTTDNAIKTLSVSDFERGIYLISFESDSFKSIKRFIKN